MQPYFTSNGLVTKALEHAFKLEHIMDLTRLRCLGSLFSMLHQACRNVAQYNANHPDFPMQIEQLERYVQVRAPCTAAQASPLPTPHAHRGVSFPGERASLSRRAGMVPERREPLRRFTLPQTSLFWS